MELRWCLALVLGAGAGLGHEVSLRLGRLGASVLAVDVDPVAAERTAHAVRASRVRAWSFGVDVLDAADARLLAARVQDLGGADLLVNPVGAWTPLTATFLAGLDGRRGRRLASAAVNVVPDADRMPSSDAGEHGARVTGLVRAPDDPDDPDDAAAATTVVDLLRTGAHGEVRTLSGPDSPAAADPVRRR